MVNKSVETEPEPQWQSMDQCSWTMTKRIWKNIWARQGSNWRNMWSETKRTNRYITQKVNTAMLVSSLIPNLCFVLKSGHKYQSLAITLNLLLSIIIIYPYKISWSEHNIYSCCLESWLGHEGCYLPEFLNVCTCCTPLKHTDSVLARMPAYLTPL